MKCDLKMLKEELGLGFSPAVRVLEVAKDLKGLVVKAETIVL